MKVEWRLDPSEVGTTVASSSRSIRHGKWAKQPSSMDEKSKTLTLIHLPTNVSVSGDIPVGHYTNKQIKEKVDSLKTKLLKELEVKVAKKLRIPGLSY